MKSRTSNYFIYSKNIKPQETEKLNFDKLQNLDVFLKLECDNFVQSIII